MAILASSTVPGMTREQYEQTAAALTEQLRAAPGFIAHYAWEQDGATKVVEVWESVEQHDDWFNNRVKPHLSVEVTTEKHELMNKLAS